jgi:hypothetical protein
VLLCRAEARPVPASVAVLDAPEVDAVWHLKDRTRRVIWLCKFSALP